MLELPPVIIQLPPLVFYLCLFLPLLLLQNTHTHTHTGEFSVRTHSRYTPDGKTTTKTVAVPDRSVAADMQMTLCYSGCSAFLDSDDSSLWNFLLKALALPHRHVERQGGFLPPFKCVCCHALWNSSIRAEGVNAVRRTR